MLEDLHWADKPTLLLLQHLARRLAAAEAPLLVAGTYRTVALDRAHPLTEVLADLHRESLCERLVLTALVREEAADLIAGLTGVTPAPAVLEAIYRETDGNPFFVEEIVRHLQAEGRNLADPGAAMGDWGIPEGLRQVIDRRVSRLSALTIRLLHAAAVLGDGFTFDLLAAVSGTDERGAGDDSSLLDALEEALAAGILREEGGSYHFSHSLIRQTLYDGLSLLRRQRLHLRAAEAIEAIHAPTASGRSLTPLLPALAMHYRLAGTAADPAKAIDFAERAGEAATAVFAWEEAAAQWQAALELMGRRADPPERRVLLLERLGDLMYFTGLDYEKGIGYLEEALKLHEELGQTERAAQLHLRLGEYLSAIPVLRNIPRALAHHRAAEAVLGRGPEGPDLAALYIGLASTAFFSVRIDEALSASRRAREIAERLGDEVLQAHAAALHGYHLFAGGRLAEGRALLEHAWETADRLNHVFVSFLAAVWLGYGSRLLADPREAQRWCLRELARPRLAQAPDPRGSLMNLLGSVYALAGELAEARRLPPEAGRLRIPTMLEAEVFLWDGAWEEAAALAAEQQEVMRRAGDRWLETHFTAALARVRRAQGEDDRAEALLREGLEIAVAGPCPVLEMRFRPELALLHAETGRAREALPHVDRCRAILATGEDWRGVAGRVSLAEAVTSAGATNGSSLPAEAERQFEEAIAVFRRYGLPWDEAETLECWARALLAAGRRAAAGEKLAAALELYRRRGAGSRWLERIGALQERYAPRRAPSVVPAYPDNLTEREVEVLRLLAGGRTSREIADELVLGVRTVDRHLSNIYAKIGARGRAEAIAYALRHDLAAPT